MTTLMAPTLGSEPRSATTAREELNFHSSARTTLGVELELQILDRESGDLAPGAVRILKACGEEKIEGVTAQVSFTSHLFDGMTTEMSSALLKGGTGRLWAAPGKFRLELDGRNFIGIENAV